MGWRSCWRVGAMEQVPQAKSLAAQFYAQQVLLQLSGRRVRFKSGVERQDFSVSAGATGVVQLPFLHEGKLVAAVRLDSPPAAAKQYDGEVHWVEDINLIDFEDEVELEA